MDKATRHAVKAVMAKIVQAANEDAPEEVIDALDYRLRLLTGNKPITLEDTNA